MAFLQPAPALDNQYHGDRALRSCLARVLPIEVRRAIEPELLEMGELAGGSLYRQQLNEPAAEPRLTHWDPWGERVDRIELTPLWKTAERIAATHGVVATAYERRHGRYSRIHQFALAYLFTPSTGVYSCPLAMTDGAARTLARSGNRALIERALPRLTSRDPTQFWTSGQWMTENIGGSDVGLSETIARRDANGWRLYGRKWFASAAHAPMALALARPEGNGPGGRGLALFYIETRDERDRPRNFTIQRLKDKLGTRQVPTAELTLDGTPAELVGGNTDGVRAIAPMLNITRTWNGIAAASYMRRGIALARAYAHQRIAFGAPLADQPLHLATLADLQAETEAALHLAFYLVEWIGRDETESLSEPDQALLRLLTPIVKLTTGRQSVAVASEILEAFGGAGYVEDTGLPLLLRDSQVFPIWEGTTNVLALEAVRAAAAASLDRLRREIDDLGAQARAPKLVAVAQTARAAVALACAWHAATAAPAREAGARRFALTLGRALASTLCVRHAQWSLDHEHDSRAAFAAVRFADAGMDLIRPHYPQTDRALARDEPTADAGFDAMYSVLLPVNS